MAEKMVSRVVTQSVTVVRDGKRVSPKIGEAFEFTEEEIKYLDSVSPRASRRPTNETPLRRRVEAEDDEGDEEDAGDDESAPDKKAAPKSTRTPKRGKAAKGDEGDGEDDDI